MKQAVLVLGGLGMLVGLIMIIMGVSGREITNADSTLIGIGFLTAVVSLIIAIVARIIISQRS